MNKEGIRWHDIECEGKHKRHACMLPRSHPIQKRTGRWVKEDPQGVGEASHEVLQNERIAASSNDNEFGLAAKLRPCESSRLTCPYDKEEERGRKGERKEGSVVPCMHGWVCVCVCVCACFACVCMWALSRKATCVDRQWTSDAHLLCDKIHAFVIVAPGKQKTQHTRYAYSIAQSRREKVKKEKEMRTLLLVGALAAAPPCVPFLCMSE